MEEVEKLFKNSTEEMEKLLTAKSVVGEPMVVDGYTIVPLLSLGFGFDAGGGGGKGKDQDNQEGEGSGGGYRWRWRGQASCRHHHQQRRRSGGAHTGSSVGAGKAGCGHRRRHGQARAQV